MSARYPILRPMSSSASASSSLLPPQREHNDPIFVVGFPRSGTTLLQALLGAHPRIAAPPEMHYFQRIAHLHDYWGDLSDDSVLHRVITETVQPPIPWLDRCNFDPDRIFERARHGPRTYAAVLDAVLTDFAERQGKERWSEKTPRQAPLPIWRHFPNAQVVHIIRDPRPTIASTMAKLGGYPDPVSAAHAWRKFTIAAVLGGARKGPAHYLRISYEDLSRDPETVMRLVFAFLGEEFDRDVISDRSRRATALPVALGSMLDDVLEPIRASDDDKWREAFPARVRAQIAAIVGDLCPLLGYPPPQAATMRLGRPLKALAMPAERVRARRLRRTMSKLTPQMRHDNIVREQIERVQRSAERRGEVTADV